MYKLVSSTHEKRVLFNFNITSSIQVIKFKFFMFTLDKIFLIINFEQFLPILFEHVRLLYTFSVTYAAASVDMSSPFHYQCHSRRGYVF